MKHGKRAANLSQLKAKAHGPYYKVRNQPQDMKLTEFKCCELPTRLNTNDRHRFQHSKALAKTLLALGRQAEHMVLLLPEDYRWHPSLRYAAL